MKMKMKMKKIRVVIADDHAVVRRGLSNIVARAGIYVCASAKNGAEAITLVNQHQPDVLIVDVKMPEMDGIEVVRKLKAAATKITILALSGYDNEGNVLAMLRAGATGFVLKDELPETLVVAVKTVAEGNPAPFWHLQVPKRGGISPSIAGPVMRVMTNELPDSSGLSLREREILRLMAKGKGNREIGNELHLSVPTVKDHISHIYDKLGTRERILAVLRAISLGIISLEEIIEELF